MRLTIVRQRVFRTGRQELMTDGRNWWMMLTNRSHAGHVVEIPTENVERWKAYFDAPRTVRK